MPVLFRNGIQRNAKKITQKDCKFFEQAVNVAQQKKLQTIRLKVYSKCHIATRSSVTLVDITPEASSKRI